MARIPDNQGEGLKVAVEGPRDKIQAVVLSSKHPYPLSQFIGLHMASFEVPSGCVKSLAFFFFF